MEYLDKIYLGNTLLQWVIAAAAVIVVYLVAELMRRVVAGRLEAHALKIANPLDDFLLELLKTRTKVFFILVMALYLGSTLVYLPARLAHFARAVVIISLALQVGIWGNATIIYLLEKRKKQLLEQDPGSRSAYGALKFISRLAMWAIIVLVTLNNLHMDVTALITGLGIGGVAVALALQNILGDLFASISIALDKPFVVGDFIILDDYMGTIEYIGIKTTRIKSLSGEQIVLSNTDLIKSRLRNYKHLSERRVVFSIGVVYQTPIEKLAAIPGIIREIINGVDKTRFDRAHFKELGDFSLIYEVVYYVNDADFNVHMDVLQAINLEIFRRFGEMGIDFAYPTRTNYQIVQNKQGA